MYLIVSNRYVPMLRRARGIHVCSASSNIIAFLVMLYMLSHCRRLSRTLEQCSIKSAEWKNMQPEFVGVQTIICTVFERLETALTSATPSC